MKLAIVGSRGIPNRRGGFEQFAEHISVELVKRGHKVVVINSHEHPNKDDYFKGVEIIRAFNPESSIGSVSHFLYDYLSIKRAIG